VLEKLFPAALALFVRKMSPELPLFLRKLSPAELPLFVRKDLHHIHTCVVFNDIYCFNNYM